MSGANLFNSNPQPQQPEPLFAPTTAHSSQNQPNPQQSQPLLPGTIDQRPLLSSPSRNTMTMLGRAVQQGGTGQNRKQRIIKCKQIYKIMESKPENLRNIENTPEIRRALSQSLQYFDKTRQKTQQYERQHAKRQNFGLTPQQLGQQCRNIKSQKIDQFWKTLTSTVSELTQVSELLIAQYLRQHIKQQQLYIKRLTTKQFYYGNYLRMPNNYFLESLYRGVYDSNEKVVSLQSEFFLELFQFLINEIYSEFVAMVKIGQFLQDKSKRFFRDVIKKESCDYFTILWRKYKYFSQSGIKKQLQAPDQRSKALKQFYLNTQKYLTQKKVHKHKITLAMSIGIALVQVLSEYGSWRRPPIVSSLINYEEAIKFVDEDLGVLVTEIAELPLREYRYVNVSLDLLLLLVPLRCLSEKPEHRPPVMQNAQIHALKTCILATKSPYLESFRFLVWKSTPQRNPNPNPQQQQNPLEKQWQKIPKTVCWMMRAEGWSEWIGLFLSLCDNLEELLEVQSLMEQIVKMVKIIVECNFEEFWSENCNYEYELIRNFMIGFIHEKGVKIFLPVLTKLLGDDNRKLQYATKTLQIIGFDGFKRQIRDNLMQSLDLSDKHNSSIRLSMFYSHHQHNQSTGSFLVESPEQSDMVRRFQSYPEQEIKFLCTLVRNCKEDLSLVESVLFQCERQNSTGVLVCKFLLECLSKLREYKAIPLKCMRYIMTTIDVLFCYEGTRTPMMIGIWLSFLEELGENNRNQLYDMVSFACLKPSASEEYRQGQKLKIVIANHICNIVRMSKYISEYFPTKQDYSQQSQYHQLNTLLIHRNNASISQWFHSRPHPNPQPTPWLLTLLLTLQSPSLLPIDYETVRMLLRKMIVDGDWRQEYLCVRSIREILNRATLVDNLLAILEPCVNGERNPVTGDKMFLFGLFNLKYRELLQSNVNIGKTAMYRENQSYFKVKEKQLSMYRKERDIVIGNIAAAIELIGTVLTIRNTIAISQEGNQPSNNTELITGLTIYTDICKLIGMRQSLYHYKVPLPVPMPIPQQNQSLSQAVLQPITPTLSINILQVLASYFNFQHRYNIPHKTLTPHCNKTFTNINQLIIYTNTNLNNLQTFTNQETQNLISSYNCVDAASNLLDLDGNQLGMRSDYGIGIGGVLRVLGQIVNGDKGGAGMLYQGLMCNDYKLVLEEGFSNAMADTRQFSTFVKQLVRAINLVVLPTQIHTILEFLTIAISQSTTFFNQLVNNNHLISLRKSIKVIIDSYQNQYQYEYQGDENGQIGKIQDYNEKIQVYNIVALFMLGLTDYRERYGQQIDTFVKLPNNLIQNLLQNLSKMQPYLRRCYTSLAPSSSPSQHSLPLHLQGYKKQSFCILYKGTINICLQLLKQYFPLESMTQNIDTMQLLLKMSDSFLWIPYRSEIDYLGIFKQKPRNEVKLCDKFRDVCVVEALGGGRVRERYGVIGQFVGFLQQVNWQFGRNYQFYGVDVFAKLLYAKFRSKQQAEKLVLAVYRYNYQSSLQTCHQKLLICYLNYLLIINSTGSYGHLLTFPSNPNPNPESTTRPLLHHPSKKQTNPSILLPNLYKYRCRQPLNGNHIFGHTIEQSYEAKLGIISQLVQYFEKDHSKQYVNDVVLYTISAFLRTLGRYGGVGGAFLGKFSRLVNFVLDSSQIRFPISGKIYTIFLGALVDCYTCSTTIVDSNYDALERICEILQGIILYGGNVRTVGIDNQIYSLELAYNEHTLQESIPLFSTILTKFLQIQPSRPNTSSHHHILHLVSTLTNSILDHYLINYLTLDLENLCLIKLTNTILTSPWTTKQTKKDQNRENYGNNQVTLLVSGIGNKFGRYLVKAMKMGDGDGFVCFLLDGLTVVHEFGADGDIGCWETVMDYMASQFNVQAKRQLRVQQPQNSYPQTFLEKTSQKPKTPLSFSPSTPHLSTLLTHTQNPTLTKLLKINKLLNLLLSICSKQLYWSNKKYSFTVESIFNCFINQNFVYKIIEVCGKIELGIKSGLGKGRGLNGSRILECWMPVQGPWQDKLCGIEVDQMQGHYYGQLDHLDDADRRNIQKIRMQGKKTNLFQFVVHVQVCNLFYQYTEILMECMSRSESLRNFYSKILSNGLNYIDQLVWQKISNTLLSILAYLKEKTISYIRFYPKSLKKLLPLYNALRSNPDIGHNSTFLSTLLTSLTDSPTIPPTPDTYKTYIMDLSLSLCSCLIKFIEIWKAHDWKSSANWTETRGKIVNQAYEFFRDCCGYVAGPGYWDGRGDGIGKMEAWLEKNQTMHIL